MVGCRVLSGPFGDWGAHHIERQMPLSRQFFDLFEKLGVFFFTFFSTDEKGRVQFVALLCLIAGVCGYINRQKGTG